MPITLDDNNGVLYQIPTINSDNWKLSPPMFFFYWINSRPIPTDFTNTILYPRYDEIADFDDFTDWKFETSIICNSPAPFVQVEFGDSHISNLGAPVNSNGAFYEKVINFNFSQATYLLSEGQYLGNVKYKVTAFNPNSGVRELISEKIMVIEFWSNNYTFLIEPPIAVVYQNRVFTFTSGGSPEALNFNYNLNGSIPPGEEIYYFVLPRSDFDWTATDNYNNGLGLMYPIHPYYSKVVATFDNGITGFAVGQYPYTLSLNNFHVPKMLIPVILNVSDEAISAFEVSPNPIEFDINIGVSSPQPKVVSIVSALPWLISSALPNWLQVSVFNGSGNATLLLTIVIYEEMIAGIYNYNLVFVSGIETLTVPVVLDLKFFIQNPFASGKLFFTENLDFINFKSELQNTFIDLNVDIKLFKLNTYEPVIYNRKYNIPLYKGIGEFHPGTVIHDLFEKAESLDEIVPVLEGSYSRTQYKPAEISITYLEKTYPGTFYLDEYLGKGTIPAFRMAKGKKPFITSSQLSLLTVGQQEFMRISPQSPLCISFSHFGTPQIIVKKNNVKIEDIIIPAFPEDNSERKVLYSFFRFLNDLKPGDVIEVMIVSALETRTQRYLVFHPGKESTFFIFLNNNDLPEFVELTGRRRISSKYAHKLNSKFKKLYSYESKVDTDNVQGMIVNSGQLLPSDHVLLDALIKSKSVWCSLDDSSGPYFMVDATNSEIQNQDTDSGEISLNIEFNILENSNDILYPRQ